MLALDPRVVDAIFEALQGHIPAHLDTHPLGCHRPRTPDRACFEGILIRLVTGCSWDVAGRLSGTSESTLRRRRDEWQAAGVFAALAEEALAGYDRIIGFQLEDVAIDTSQHKAPFGGEGTGPNGCDRGKLGWKWSILTGTDGIPIGWCVGAANRHDSKLLEPTLDAAEARGLLLDIGCLYLDRGYDHGFVDDACRDRDLEVVIARRRPQVRGRKKHYGNKRTTPRTKVGLRWPVERTNSWLSNFGQLRRNTDRYIVHRQAALELAIALIITVKLVKWARRWQLALTA